MRPLFPQAAAITRRGRHFCLMPKAEELPNFPKWLPRDPEHDVGRHSESLPAPRVFWVHFWCSPDSLNVLLAPGR